MQCMYINNIFRVFFFLFLFLFSSCSNDKEANFFNILSDSQRTNSYEEFGSFWNGIIYSEKLSTSDTSGFLTYPLHLGKNFFVSGTNLGWIVLLKHSSLVWERKLEDNQYVISNFVADERKNIYFITNQMLLYSVSFEGEFNWKVAIPDTSKMLTSLLISSNGISFFVSNTFYLFDFHGKLKFKKTFSIVPTQHFSFYDDSYFVNLTNNTLNITDTLVVFDKNGSLRWQWSFERVRLLRAPVVNNNKVYLIGYNEVKGDLQGYLFCLDLNGRLLWKTQLPLVPRYISVSRGGDIFLVLYNTGLGENISAIFRIGENGKILFKQYVRGTITSPVLISRDKLCVLCYVKGFPSLMFFENQLNLLKTFDLAKYPTPVNYPLVLEDATIVFLSSQTPQIVRIDENPIIKLLPW